MLGALDIAAGEAADQRDVHAADEADLAGLRRHGRQHPDQERALLLLEDDGAHVLHVHHAVDDGEPVLRILHGDLFQGRRLGEADTEDRVRAALGHPAQGLLALGLVGDLEFAIVDAGLFLELLDAVIDAFVEAFVEFAAHVEDDGGLEIRRGDRADQHGQRDGGAENTKLHG